MSERLIFCRDEVLRKVLVASRSGAGVRREVPLLALQEISERVGILSCLDDHVTLEDGLTVSELLRNVSPWAEKIGDMAGADLPAFITEAGSPAARRTDDVDRVEITHLNEMSPVPKFEGGNFQPGMRWEDLDLGTPAFSGAVSVRSGWRTDGVLKESAWARYRNEKIASLDMTPVSEWAHLPVSISRVSTILDETSLSGGRIYLGHPTGMIDLDHPNARRESELDPVTVATEAPRPDLFNCVIRGFISQIGVCGSPSAREDVIRKLRGSIASLETGDQEARSEEEDMRRMAAFEAAERLIMEAESASERLGLKVR